MADGSLSVAYARFLDVMDESGGSSSRSDSEADDDSRGRRERRSDTPEVEVTDEKEDRRSNGGRTCSCTAYDPSGLSFMAGRIVPVLVGDVERWRFRNPGRARIGRAALDGPDTGTMPRRCACICSRVILISRILAIR